MSSQTVDVLACQKAGRDARGPIENKTMRKLLLLIAVCLLAGLLLPAVPATAQSEAPPIFRAVLFYTPTCPHCHYIMTEVLPPLQEQYGEQLDILEVDASVRPGSQVFEAYLEEYQVPRERVGVPALLVEDVAMVGRMEIPQMLPLLLEQELKVDGTEWPSISGLDAIIAGEVTTVIGETPSGLGLAWVVLMGLLATLLYVGWRLVRAEWASFPAAFQGSYRPLWLLVLVGLGVSAYLSYVELTHSDAICGPVGDCNAVQSSAYAQIAGVPVALLGLLFYGAVGALVLALPRLRQEQHRPATLTILGLVVAGVLFSVYLTAIEIFALQAVCAWCLASAVVSLLLLLWVTAAFVPRPGAGRRAARARRRTAHTRSRRTAH